MTTITPEIRQAIKQAGEQPVQLTDTETNSLYVIMRAEVYERLRASCDDFDTRDAYPAMDQVAAREGWDDPSMDIYNEYKPTLANLFTIEKRLVHQRIGVLSAGLMAQIDACLKAALNLP